MSATPLVIGSSGFLGREVACLLDKTQATLTHFHTPAFPGSIKFDFFKDDLPVTDNPAQGTIFFTAAVESRHPAGIVTDRMSHLLDQINDRRFVYLSSDGIFSGQEGFYSEESDPDPVTLYGHNLLACEKLITARCKNYCIIRPSYIYGISNGVLDSRLSRTRASLLNEQSVALFDDMFKSPLGVTQVAQAVIRLGLSEFIGTVHVAGGRMSVYEFHRQAMRTLGIDTSSLVRDKMPRESGWLKDTSLVSEKWQSMLKSVPLSVAETLTQAGKLSGS